MNITDLKGILKKISDESGKEFIDLSNAFPVLIEEVNFSDAASNSRGAIALREFNQIKEHLLETVQLQYEMQQHNHDLLQNLQKQNTSLFESFVKRMQFLNKMNELISVIKDESMEMEIISLNAMIVSIKSGKQGEAFSYITSNLKRLSYMLITQSETLTSHEKAIQKEINELKKIIDNAESLSKSAQGIENSAGEQIADIVNGILSSLHGMLELAGTVKQPIIKAMECLQTQDIVRQSIDDIILTIGKIDDSLKLEENQLESETEFAIDQHCFKEKLAELSVCLLKSVNDKLTDSTQKFKQNQALVNSILGEVDSKRSVFIEMHSKHSASSGTLKDCIVAATNEINEFMRMSLAFQSSQKNVMKQSEVIQESVFRMHTCFADFFPIIDNLHYVAIAQRIEVARNEAISTIHSTVEYMSNLIGQTNGNVKKAQEQLQQFTDASTKDIDSFASNINEEKKYFSELEKEKHEVTGAFDSLNEEFMSAIGNFTVYSPDFFAAYEKILKAIENVEKLSGDILTVEAELQKIAKSEKEKKEALLKEIGASSWEIKDNRFSDIIKHFTIVSDKQTAGDIAGFEVEDGKESGEITFF